MKKQYGFSLLETMLIIAIGAALVVFGVKAVSRFNYDSEAQKIAANVDYLFQGIGNYYLANCRGQYNPTASDPSEYKNYTGTLNPGSVPTSPFVLLPSALLSSSLISKWPLSNSTLVDNNDANAYVTQLNVVIISSKTTSGCWNTSGTTQCDSISSPTLSLFWEATVGVKIADTSKIQALKAMLNATCISTFSTRITNCPPDVSGGNYLVWTRLPSNLSSLNTSSPLTSSMAVLKQFTAMYTNDSIYEATASTTAPSNAALQFYLCGG